MKFTAKFKADKITAVYSGQDGKCCCGCAGKHYNRREDGAKALPMINRVAQIMNDPSVPFDMEPSTTFVSKVIGKRLYVAYFDAR